MTQFVQAVRLVGRDVGDAEVSMAMCVRVLDRVETRSVVVPRDEYVVQGLVHQEKGLVRLVLLEEFTADLDVALHDVMSRGLDRVADVCRRRGPAFEIQRQAFDVVVLHVVPKTLEGPTNRFEPILREPTKIELQTGGGRRLVALVVDCTGTPEKLAPRLRLRVDVLEHLADAPDVVDGANPCGLHDRTLAHQTASEGWKVYGDRGDLGGYLPALEYDFTITTSERSDRGTMRVGKVVVESGVLATRTMIAPKSMSMCWPPLRSWTMSSALIFTRTLKARP